MRVFIFYIFTLLVLAAPIFAQTPTAPTILPDKDYVVQEISGGVYWISDGAYNTMFVVSDEGVIVIDPLPTLGERYLKAIREVTDQPIKFIIYSHSHTDHIGASSLFPKTAKIIAQTQTAAILKRRNDPRRPLPDIVFDKNYTLKLGNQTLELSCKGDNHEPGNIYIYAPKQKILMVVDVVYPGFMPYKNLGITDDVQGLIEAHDEILKYDFNIFVAGHVTRLGNKKDVEVSKEFLIDLKAVAGKDIAALPFPVYLKSEAAQKMLREEKRSKWDLHNEYEKALIKQCRDELAARWTNRLQDTETYLSDNCWTMIEALTVALK